MIARATHQDLGDRNDTRGTLDLRAVSSSGGIEYPRWTFRTFEKWRAAEIFDRGFFVLQFDTFGDTHFDYYALLRSEGGRLKGSLHRDFVRRRDERVSGLNLSRPGRSSVRVRVPLKKMKFGERFDYRWVSQSLWTGPKCRNVCIDRAPDRGAVVEPEPATTISPTVTVVPSPTD